MPVERTCEKKHGIPPVFLVMTSVLLLAAATPGTGDLRIAALGALVPLYVAIRNGSAIRNFLLGWMMGVFYACIATNWIVPTSQNILKYDWIGATGVLLATGSWQGLQFGCAALLFTISKKHVPSWLAFASSIGIAEALFPHLFPLSYSLILNSTPLLLQTADIGGQATVAFFMALANASVGDAVFHAIKKQPIKKTLRAAAPAAAAMLFVVGYGMLRVHFVDAAVRDASGIQVAAVQPGIFPEEAHRNNDAFIEAHVELSRQTFESEKVDLLVWSECLFSDAMTNRELFLKMRSLLAGFPVPTLLGAPVVQSRHTKPQTHFNAAVLAEPDGWVCPMCRYDKTKLFPIGERYVSARISNGRSMAVEGDGFKSIRYRNHSLAVFICYESLFPGYVRRLAKDTELLVNLADDGWFGGTAEPRIHEALSRVRAIENRKALVRVAASGISTIVDPVGRVVQRTQVGENKVLVSRVVLMNQRTPYSALGNSIWWMLLFIVHGAGWLFVRFSQKRK